MILPDPVQVYRIPDEVVRIPDDIAPGIVHHVFMNGKPAARYAVPKDDGREPFSVNIPAASKVQ
jgi:hypothetical protein